MNTSKKILNFFHPLLKPLSEWYSAKVRSYTFQDITVKVHPGVFHPGLFFSTKIILRYLENLNLQGERILELGAGTGLISIYCFKKKGAQITASDISISAVSNIRENAVLNKAAINVIHSDLFERITPDDFDIIIINPPFYPREVKSEKDHAWFCGRDFQFFKRLFAQIKQKRTSENRILMILSEECDLKEIKRLANEFCFELESVFAEHSLGEENCIYLIKNI
jgi:release factor glutamine methyltransferase